MEMTKVFWQLREEFTNTKRKANRFEGISMTSCVSIMMEIA